MNTLIQILKDWFASQQLVYVSGNLLLFYVRGNKRRHVSPDVLVVKGVPRGDRLNYILWEEGKGPDFIIELTSSSTRHKDTSRKFKLYQDVLKVKEYFLFDPLGDYLHPRLQGYRLRAGKYVKYVPIRAMQGRLPSQIIGLHLEQDEEALRLYDPATGRWLPTARERIAQAETARERAELAEQRAELARGQAELALQRTELARQQEAFAHQQAEAELERLRRQLEELGRSPQQP
jgi:Uma2 family endonuclease